MWADASGNIYRTHTEARRAIKGVSLPAVLNDTILARFGIVPVVIEPAPVVDHTEVVEEVAPVKVGDTWVKGWAKRQATPEELDERTARKAAEVRAARDVLLRGCDWTQLADSPVVPATYRTYRNALREIDLQAGFPFNVTWPALP